MNNDIEILKARKQKFEQQYDKILFKSMKSVRKMDTQAIIRINMYVLHASRFINKLIALSKIRKHGNDIMWIFLLAIFSRQIKS